MTVRELVFQYSATDAALNTLGFNRDTTYANGAPESPKARRWAVLRWGPETPGAGGQRGRPRTTDREVTFWVYDKERNYDTINLAIKRWCEIMDALEARRTGQKSGDGWISVCDWQGDADDTYDDVYEAWAKSSTYRIIASGD